MESGRIETRLSAIKKGNFQSHPAARKPTLTEDHMKKQAHGPKITNTRHLMIVTVLFGRTSFPHQIIK